MNNYNINFTRRVGINQGYGKKMQKTDKYDKIKLCHFKEAQNIENIQIIYKCII